MSEVDESRRKFIQKVAYAAPMIATISVLPSIASAGSCNNGVGNGADCLPPGLEKNDKVFLDNDDNGGVPGSPQNRGGPGT
jgi:hypothetical protein